MFFDYLCIFSPSLALDIWSFTVSTSQSHTFGIKPYSDVRGENMSSTYEKFSKYGKLY
jgi:hypothetical protein